MAATKEPNIQLTEREPKTKRDRRMQWIRFVFLSSAFQCSLIPAEQKCLS